MRDDDRVNGVSHGAVPFGRRPLPAGGASSAVGLDDPVDLVAVQADDELIGALSGGPSVSPPGVGHGDDRLVAMLAAWRAEIDAEPIPELIDLDAAVAAVVAGSRAEAAATRRRRAGRGRHLAPLAAAAAIIVATVGGVGLGSQDAMPGDTLWPIQKVVNPERAESVEAKVAVEGRLERVRTALSSGDTTTAARELDAIRTEIPAVRSQEGLPLLVQEQDFLAAKLVDTEPGRPVDLTTPPRSRPGARSTGSPAVPPVLPPAPVPGSSAPVPGPAVPAPESGPASGDPRRSTAPAPDSKADSAGPEVPPRPDVSAPQVTRQPDSTSPGPAPPPGRGPGRGPGPGSGSGSGEGSTNPTTAPDPSAPGGSSVPGGSSAPGGGPVGTAPPSDTTTTASGSAGTDVATTATSTAS